MIPGDDSAIRQDAARNILRRRLLVTVASALVALAVLLGLVGWYSHYRANREVSASFADAIAGQRERQASVAERIRLRQRAAGRTSLSDQCQALARLLAGVSATPLLIGDLDSIDRSCDEMMRHPDVALACLVGDDGIVRSRVVSARARDLAGLPLEMDSATVVRRVLATTGQVSARVPVLTERGVTIAAVVVATDERLQADRLAIAADFTGLDAESERGLSELGASLEHSLRATTAWSLGFFALLALATTCLVMALVRRRIGTVAAEFDRLTQRIQRLVDDLSSRTRQLEDANAAAVRGRELLNVVLQRMGEAVLVVDHGGVPILWNHRARDLIGLSNEDTRSGARSLVESLREADGATPVPPERSPLSIALGGKPVDDRLLYLGGRWLSASARPLLHADGRLRGAVLVLHDVTDLRRANDELERRVAERTSELEATQRRLVEAARRAGMAEVASEILHNVGNVLTSLNVSTAILADRVRESVVDRLAELAQRAQGDAGLASRLPGHLAALSSALSEERESNLTALDELRVHLDHVAYIVGQQQRVATAAAMIEELDPRRLVEDALHIALAGLAEPPRIERRYSEIPGFRCDRHRLLQILINLLVNARRALDGSKQASITVAVEAIGLDVHFTVTDSGCGIAPDVLPRIFDLGFTTHADGRGVGLNASANATRLLGGTLTAASEGPGCGASFLLVLPRDPQAAGSATSE